MDHKRKFRQYLFWIHILRGLQFLLLLLLQQNKFLLWYILHYNNIMNHHQHKYAINYHHIHHIVWYILHKENKNLLYIHISICSQEFITYTGIYHNLFDNLHQEQISLANHLNHLMDISYSFHSHQNILWVNNYSLERIHEHMMYNLHSSHQ